jgi:hypothetical protein
MFRFLQLIEILKILQSDEILNLQTETANELRVRHSRYLRTIYKIPLSPTEIPLKHFILQGNAQYSLL